jgi:hypothetical protein
MNTKSLYESDAQAALRLSAKERAVAEQLKQDRPEVYPGTRAILDRTQAVIWFDKVKTAMRALGIDRQEKVSAFCDLAGVPD